MDVQVRQSGISGAGRGLFATKNFAPGDVVVSLERPYVAELDTPRLRDTCAWCFRRSAGTEQEKQSRVFAFLTGAVETKACTGCHRVRYCSKTCQSRAWKREHKHECKAIAPEARPDMPHGVRAVIKLLGKLKSDPDGKDERLLDILHFMPCGSGDLRAVDAFKKAQPKKFDDFSMLAYGAWKYAGEPKIGDMDAEMIAKAFFFNVNTNTFQLSNALDDVSLGFGFDPILCSANHACDPNVAFLFNQPKTLLRAVKPINKGEEIYMGYVDVSNPFSVRQMQLRKQYNFTCSCVKCEKGAATAQDHFLKSPERLSAVFAKVADGLIRRHEKQLSDFQVSGGDELAQRRIAAIQAEAFSVSGITSDFNSSNQDASEDEILDALKLCLNSGMFSMTRQPVPHLIRQLFSLYMAQGRIYQAWRVGALQHVVIEPERYPYLHDGQKAIDSWAMTTTTDALRNPSIPEHKEIFDECMKSGLDLNTVYFGFLFKTREVVEKSYGRESPFGTVVETIYQMAISNTELSVDQIKMKVQETWPKFEAVAKSVDILKM